MKIKLKVPRIPVLCLDFGRVDRAIEMIGEIRDSYQAANVSVYGQLLAEMLNAWQ